MWFEEPLKIHSFTGRGTYRRCSPAWSTRLAAPYPQRLDQRGRTEWVRVTRHRVDCAAHDHGMHDQWARLNRPAIWTAQADAATAGPRSAAPTSSGVRFGRWVRPRTLGRCRPVKDPTMWLTPNSSAERRARNALAVASYRRGRSHPARLARTDHVAPHGNGLQAATPDPPRDLLLQLPAVQREHQRRTAGGVREFLSEPRPRPCRGVVP
jgi:hypothetical protein